MIRASEIGLVNLLEAMVEMASWVGVKCHCEPAFNVGMFCAYVGRLFLRGLLKSNYKGNVP